jgi:hypothetical protein
MDCLTIHDYSFSTFFSSGLSCNNFDQNCYHVVIAS